ncbi:MAG: hypothetical protein M3460_20860 [Actinomycetota bacterium]|nr:hypothetical protein [Actinomycetota bacterium]
MQPTRERPAEHLDRAWPGIDRDASYQVADERVSRERYTACALETAMS